MTVFGVPLPPPPPPTRTCHPSFHRPSAFDAARNDPSQSRLNRLQLPLSFPTFAVGSVSLLPPHPFSAITKRAFVPIILGDALLLCLPIPVRVD